MKNLGCRVPAQLYSRVKRREWGPVIQHFAAITVLFSACLVAGTGAIASEPDSEILGANGMYFDKEDRLYVASANSASVFVIDPDSGEVLKNYGSEQGIHSPDDVVVDSDGTIYVTNYFEGNVVSVSTDGVARDLGNVGQGVNPITLDDDGTVWVGRGFPGDGLYAIDPVLAAPPRLVADSLNWINAMDIGPDGMLYGPVSTKEVVKVDLRTGKVETVADGFKTNLHAVKFDNLWQMHVVEGRPGRVLRVDLANKSMEVIATYPPGLDNLAFDSNNRLFISSYLDGSVHQVVPGGSLRQLLAPSDRAPWAHRLTLLRVLVVPVLLPILMIICFVIVWRLRRRRAR